MKHCWEIDYVGMVLWVHDLEVHSLLVILSNSLIITKQILDPFLIQCFFFDYTKYFLTTQKGENNELWVRSLLLLRRYLLLPNGLLKISVKRKGEQFLAKFPLYNFKESFMAHSNLGHNMPTPTRI